MSQYNQNILHPTDEELALRKAKREQKEAERKAKLQKKTLLAQEKADKDARTVAATNAVHAAGYPDFRAVPNYNRMQGKPMARPVARSQARPVARPQARPVSRPAYGNQPRSRPNYNSKPKARPGYDFARVNGNYVAVPVTKRGNVPVAAVRATGAARNPQALARDRSGRAAKVRYDPYRMNAQQYASWARNPGRSDVIGIDCRSNAKPTRSMNTKAVSAPAYTRVNTSGYHKIATINDRRGQPVKVPVNSYGYVSQPYLRQVQAQRPKNAIKMDSARTSRKVMGPNLTPYQARPWIMDPSSMDIKGIDAPKTAKVTYSRPKTMEEAKALQAKKNKINGAKGGKATAAKKKAAKATAAKKVAKPAAKKVAKPVAKKAPAKAPAKKVAKPAAKKVSKPVAKQTQLAVANKKAKKAPAKAPAKKKAAVKKK